MSPVLNHRDKVRDYLLQSAETKKAVAEECIDSILRAADLIGKCFRSGGKALR